MSVGVFCFKLTLGDILCVLTRPPPPHPSPPLPLLSRKNHLSKSDLLPRANYSLDYYFKPYNRMGPYIIGMLTGYLLYVTDCRVKLNKVIVLITRHGTPPRKSAEFKFWWVFLCVCFFSPFFSSGFFFPDFYFIFSSESSPFWAIILSNC